MGEVCFIDTETTGLDPDRHTIWEVALITPDGAERVWQFPIDEMAADPFALNIGRYWERAWSTTVSEINPIDAVYEAHTAKSRRKNFPDQGRSISPDPAWCGYFRNLTANLYLCGTVVSFDEERLRRLLHSKGAQHRWHYHLINVEVLAAGFLRGRLTAQVPATREAADLPWNSEELSKAVGVDPENFDRHTALGDARWAKAIYEAVIAGGEGAR